MVTIHLRGKRHLSRGCHQ